MHRVGSLLFAALLLAAGTLSAQINSNGTVIRNRAAARTLIGKHPFQLHWISWMDMKKFGTLTVRDSAGTYVIRGRYERDGEWCWIDGTITEVMSDRFIVQGVIDTRVAATNNGEPCHRNGRFTFAKTQRRRYWRMQEMENCERNNVVDYIDIMPRSGR